MAVRSLPGAGAAARGQEGEAIRRLIERRTGGRTPGSRKEWQKLYGYLGRKGFSFEEIRRVLGDVPERDESELPDRENP